MELDALDRAGVAGVGLSVEERAVLEILFAQQRLDAKQGSVWLLWGRVEGTAHDYLVAATRADGTAPGYRFHYCVTGAGVMSLVPLPELLEEHRRIAAAVGNGRFLGVPDTPLGPQQADEDAEEEAAEEAAAAEAPDERAADESQLDEEGNPLTPPPPPAAPARAAKPPKPVVFTEAHRLAWTVHAIAADTTLVPAGAFVVEPNGGGVSVNPSFTGINPSLVGGDASVLASLLHFRPPTAPERQRALAHGGLLAPASWLDPASEDTPLPSIVWAVRKDASAGDGRLRLVARSLKWPGAHFVMAIGGPDFGNFYVGQGTEEMALPFMV